MPRLRNFAAVITLCMVTFFVSGCASIGKAQCEAGDWYSLGENDGRFGRSMAGRLQQHNKACAKHGYEVDGVVYEDGYRAGIKQYCVYSKGLELGEKGSPYSGICESVSARSEQDILSGYMEGLINYHEEIENQITELTGEQENALNEIETINTLENPNPEAIQYYQAIADDKGSNIVSLGKRLDKAKSYARTAESKLARMESQAQQSESVLENPRPTSKTPAVDTNVGEQTAEETVEETDSSISATTNECSAIGLGFCSTDGSLATYCLNDVVKEEECIAPDRCEIDAMLGGAVCK